MDYAYELAVRMHAALTMVRSGERGQGTVEYVGLILLIAGVIGAVVAFGDGFKGDGIGKAVTDKLEGAINGLKGGK
jgi:hypothetical protein